MDNDFNDEIMKIAAAHAAERAARHEPPDAAETEKEKTVHAAVEEFYAVSRRAITIYNGVAGASKLALNRLTPDFLDLFLNIPGRLAGFSIISSTGIVIFFDEDPDIITVIGKKRKSEGQDAGKLSPAVQLMKIHYRADESGISFRDNSGAAVDPEGLVPLFVRWVSRG
ncbi:MAG: hypothetical protein IT344_09420 [Candidatus Dadabacteria bacterium]|nr:hypothetical protein [Candidatus Dadabacteria bacterium]